MAEMNDRMDESLTAEEKKEVAERVAAFETASAKQISVRIYKMLGKPYPLTAIEEIIVGGFSNFKKKWQHKTPRTSPTTRWMVLAYSRTRWKS